jgi:hypothetical protein
MLGLLILLLLFAVLAWAIGGMLLYTWQRTRHRAGLIGRTQTSDAAGISALSPGTPVEVKGTLRCDSPLKSEMAGEDCAYFHPRVTREYVSSAGDNAGSDRLSETLSEEARAVPFFVEDDTGEVRVHPEGSEVDARRVVDRFESSANPVFALGGVQVPFEDEDDTLGYRYIESVLFVDAPIYVLGVVREDGGIGAGATPVDAPIKELPLVRGGQLETALPSTRERARRFVISHRSEEALGRELARTSFWMGVGAMGTLALAAILTVVSFLVATN